MTYDMTNLIGEFNKYVAMVTKVFIIYITLLKRYIIDFKKYVLINYAISIVGRYRCINWE